MIFTNIKLAYKVNGDRIDQIALAQIKQDAQDYPKDPRPDLWVILSPSSQPAPLEQWLEWNRIALSPGDAVQAAIDSANAEIILNQKRITALHKALREMDYSE